MLDRVRNAIRQRLADIPGDASHAGVVIALAVGGQNAIPDAEWALFRTTGVTHLMSISGLHVTLLPVSTARASTLRRHGRSGGATGTTIEVFNAGCKAS